MNNASFSSLRICIFMAVVFIFGFLLLALRLKAIQVDAVAVSLDEADKQSVRLVRTDGTRGRILDRNSLVLAGNRPSTSLAINVAFFSKKTESATIEALKEEIANMARVIGRNDDLPSEATLKRHLKQNTARPLILWRDVSQSELARFSEHLFDSPGFLAINSEERIYTYDSLASHIIGYVGRDRTYGETGDRNIRYFDMEMRGRAGLEYEYDSFLRGMPGEKQLRVDARGYTHEETTTIESTRGPDLLLTIDARIQSAVEKELKGHRGACVVLDPRNGEILALASSPSFNLNSFVPSLPHAVYNALSKDEENKPLLNRAVGGLYAPGSTFKTITALAALNAGKSASSPYECIGFYKYGAFKIRCTRTWGHGSLTLADALKESCNAYFAQIGMDIGTNALFSAARAFGLGEKTGIDFSIDSAGVIPDDAWKRARYNEPWYPGDLAQMSIGQGMLLVSPLQMAIVAGALGTGYRITPHLRSNTTTKKIDLPFSKNHLDHVRDGMRKVVEKGTGRRANENLDAWLIGKTGTAEIGRGENKRKNTWFIAYAESCARDHDGRIVRISNPDNIVALAMVIENGESGGSTTAPKAGAILRHIFNGEEKSEGAKQ